MDCAVRRISAVLIAPLSSTWDMDKSTGHVAFIGEHEFYMSAEGLLMRASKSIGVGNNGCRTGEVWAWGRAVEFALEMARLDAAGKKNQTLREP